MRRTRWATRSSASSSICAVWISPFEVLAINAGSWDTSFAVLKLLAAEVPELRVLDKDVGARVYVRGAAEARGSSVVFMEADRVPMSLSPLGWTLSRLAGGTEAVVVRSRWIAARRLPALPAIARARGRGDLFERSFEREAAELRLEVVGTARRVPTGLLAPGLAPFGRLTAALARPSAASPELLEFERCGSS